MRSTMPGKVTSVPPKLGALRSTLTVLAAATVAFAAAPVLANTSVSPADRGDKLLIVDCLLPGQVRKVGASATFLTARQAVKTSAADCEIRGGEYVAYDRANYRTALNIWLPLATNGDKQAQTYVGEIFEKGLGLAPDYQVALTWYKRAADQGYSRALVNMGFLYEKGLGVRKDATTALNLYRRAAGLEGAIALDDDSSSATQHLAEEVSSLQGLLAETRRSLDTANTGRANAETARDSASRQLAEAARRNDKPEITFLKDRLAARDKEVREQAEELQRLQRQALRVSDELGRTEAASKTQGDASHQAALRARDEEIAKLSRELVELHSHKGNLEAERQRLDDSRRALLADKEAAVKANEQSRVKLLEAQLNDKDAEIERRRDQAARLEKELEQSRTIAGTLQSGVSRGERGTAGAASLAVLSAPPSIYLIDPELVASRGSTATVAVKPGIDVRDLIARVVAPAGLMSLTVNDRRQEWEPNGLFKTSIGVQPGQTPVQIVAVDRQGQRATLQFLMSAGDAQAIASKIVKPVLPRIEFGSYYALVIGNENYQKLPRLETAVADARVVGQLLQNKFGFNVTVLSNATRYQILTELNRLRDRLTDKDNLLIYYAGHGELDRANLRGHWLPIDAEPDSDANWISTVAVTDILNAMTAKHVLIVADSCYSGALTRSSIGRLDAGMSDDARANWLKAIVKTRSRTVLTSGGLQPVADGGGGKHSVFAKSFIDVLNSVSDVIEAQRLYQEVSARVLNAALEFKFDQRPEYAPMKYAGHESGDFLFVPRN